LRGERFGAFFQSLVVEIWKEEENLPFVRNSFNDSNNEASNSKGSIGEFPVKMSSTINADLYASIVCFKTGIFPFCCFQRRLDANIMIAAVFVVYVHNLTIVTIPPLLSSAILQKIGNLYLNDLCITVKCV
jgi:hypothetical protein